MAFNDESDYNKARINLFKLLPDVFQSSTNQSVFENLFNRYLSKNETANVSGYVGEGNPTAFLQRQIPEPTPHRQAYQLQPLLYSKVGTIEHMMSFKDVQNEISRLGVDTNRMKLWGNTEQFNWAPPIDFDKIINYFDYYWYDPDSNFTSNPQYITVKNPCLIAEALITEFERVIDVSGAEIDIVGLNALTNTITINVEAATEVFVEGFVFFVRNSTNTDINDKFFTVSSSATNGSFTDIIVQQDITDDSIVNGIVSLNEQLELLQTARDIICTGGVGWDIGLWDDNQPGTILWNTVLMAAITHPTLASWITANGTPVGSPDSVAEYPIWYNTTSDALQQWNGTGSAVDPANWDIVQGNFSVILLQVTGSLLWDATQQALSTTNDSIQQWIDENKWLHKNDVPNFTVAKRAQLPIIEYYSSVEINEWTYTTYSWKYRATVFDPWEEVNAEPFLIELLDPDYVDFLYEIDAPNRTIILDERYGDLTSNFTPGAAFFIDNSTNNIGAYTVEYSTYQVDSLSSVNTSPYRTRIKVVESISAASGSPYEYGNIRPGITSKGDPFVDFETHWLYVGVEQTRPVPHQPENVLLYTDAATNTAGPGNYTSIYGPFVQEFITTVDGELIFDFTTGSPSIIRPDSTRGLHELALAGFNDIRVYKNDIRQYGNYTERTYTAPVIPGSPTPSPAVFVSGIEFDSSSPTLTGDTIRVEIAEAAQEDLGFYLAHVRTDESEASFLLNGKQPISLIHYRKEEQVKKDVQQYPLFDMYNLDGTPAYRVSPLFAYGISQEAPIESNTGLRIVKSNDLKNYQFEQFLIDEDNGPLFAYRDNTLVSAEYWASVEQLIISDGSSETANVHRWLGETWTKRNVQMNVFHMKPILSPFEPTATTHPQFTSGSPGIVFDGILWYDVEAQKLYVRDNTNAGTFKWNEITDKLDQINDPTITTIWRTSHPTPVIYEPLYVDEERNEVPVGSVSGDWEIPNQLYYNPHHANRRFITFRELINHLDSVIQAQPQLPGYIGGKGAQWRLLSAPNFGLGGRIHEYNDSYDSFLSATFVNNVTPLSLFEFAHDQYEASLNELKEIYRRQVVDILTNYGLDLFNAGADIANSIIEQYELDDSKAFTYSDTTAFDGTNGIRNWIATLPLFFLTFRTLPYRLDDDVLNIHETLHHDGHRSTVKLTNVTNESVILQTINTLDSRTTNEKLGVQSSLPPPATVAEFLNEFPSGLRSHVYWYQVVSGTRTLYRLQIKYIQSSAPPVAVDPDGAHWFDTLNSSLKVLQNLTWVDVYGSPSSDIIDDAWEVLDVNSILTDIILEAEQRLYAVSPQIIRTAFDFNSLQTTPADIALYETLLEEAFNAFVHQSEIEDPYVSIYDASNAFTWNYVNSIITSIDPYPGYDSSIRGGAYQDLYQKVYGTPYPHLEPWILQGYREKPTWWDAEYLNDDPLTYGERRWKYIHSPGSPIPTGMWSNILQGIVPAGYELPDGVTTSTGAAGEVQTYNYVSVNIENVAIDNGSGPIESDGLFPPYWNPIPVYGVNTGSVRSLYYSLAEVISEDVDYTFSDSGFIEWEWRNSSQFLYDQLTIAYRMQPVRLIHHTLGIDFLEVGKLQVNRRTNKVYSHRDTLFHGEIININQVLSFNGILQWYVNYNRFLGYDINASDFGKLWVTWNTPLAYQFSSLLDSTSFFISSDVVDITSSDYNITMKRSPGISDHWMDAFSIAPTRIPSSLLNASRESDWEFSFDTFSATGRSLTCYPVRRYQFGVDPATGICTLYSYIITAVDAVNDIFSVLGDQTEVFAIGSQFQVDGSKGNDGLWQVLNSAYSSGTNTTRITIDPSYGGSNDITSSVVDGKIIAAFRTLPWSNGQEVYLSTTNTLPSPLAEEQAYFIRVKNATQFYLVDNLRDLVVDTLIPAFDGEGEGNHYIGEVSATFVALDGARTDNVWYHYAIDTRYEQVITIPKQIRGFQTLINTIDGCIAWNEQDGFSFNHDRSLVDDATSRLINWQLEEERFIDSAYQLRQTRSRRLDSYDVIVDLFTNVFTFQTTPPNWTTGTRVAVKSTGALPAPLLVDEGIYIIRDPNDDTQFALAATLSEAIREIAIDIVSSGSGTLSIFAKPVAPLSAPRFEVNAFRDKLWFVPNQGIVADIIKGPYVDVRTTQLFQDQYQRPLRANNLKVFRQDKLTEFRMLPEIPNDVDKRVQRLRAQGLTDPYNYIHMTAAHVFIDGYEHVLLLNDCTIDNDLLYDRFVGVNLKRFDLEFDRQQEFTLRPSVGGYFLSQDSNDPTIENKLIRNIEASAEDMQIFYDTHSVSETLPIMKYSRDLLGYEGIREDLRQIQINPKSQFVFWRGMVQYKGAVDPIKAFINSRRFVDARVDEFWAYKIADFGGGGEQKYPQIRLLSTDARSNNLPLHFVVDESETETGFTSITIADQDRWYNQPDQKALLAENGNLLYFEPNIKQRLDINDHYPLVFDRTIVKHNFRSDSVIITFKIYEDGIKEEFALGSPLPLAGSPIVLGSPTTIGIQAYIPGTGMIEVFAGGQKLVLNEHYTEGVSVGALTNYIVVNSVLIGKFIGSPTPPDKIEVVYRTGRLLEDVHYERVNSKIIRFINGIAQNPSNIIHIINNLVQNSSENIRSTNREIRTNINSPGGSPGTTITTTIVVYTVGANTLQVFFNGQKAIIGVDYTEVSNTSILWIGAPIIAGADTLEFFVNVTEGYEQRNDINAVSGSTITLNLITYTTGADNLHVYLNGIKAIKAVDYNEISNNQIQWTGVAITASVDIVEFYVAPSSGYEVLTGSTITPGQFVVLTTTSYTLGSNNLQVYLNGQKVMQNIDYIEINSTQIQWNGVSISPSDVIEFIVIELFGSPAFAGGSPAFTVGSPALIIGSPALIIGSPALIIGSPVLVAGSPAFTNFSVTFGSPAFTVDFLNMDIWSVVPNNAVFNPAKVRDIFSDLTLYNVQLWDPSRERHYHNAIAEIELQRPTDPARYTNTRDNTYLSDAYWSQPEVGTTWLDVSNIDYVPYYDDKVYSLEEQLTEWGRLADYSEVTAFEWVESDVLPLDWNTLAAQQTGDSSIVERERKTGSVRAAVFSRTRRHYTVTQVILQTGASASVELDPAVYGVTGDNDATGLLASAVQVYRITTTTPGPTFTLSSPYIINQGLLEVTVNGNPATFTENSSTQFTVTSPSLAIDDVVSAIITAPDYQTQVTIDGNANIITINGNDAQTFGQLIERIIEDISGATVILDENKIIITSVSLGSLASVLINDSYNTTTPLFSSLINFDSIVTISGTDTTFIAPGHTFVDNDTVFLSSTDTLPIGLEQGEQYIVTGSNFSAGSPLLGSQFRLNGIEVQDVGSGTITAASSVWEDIWTREVAIKEHFDVLTDYSTGLPTGFNLNTTDINVGDIVNIYVNGNLTQGNFTISSTFLALTGLEEVDTVTIIKPKHIITGDEITFDPDVDDDGTTHIQYIEDYDYSQVARINEDSGVEELTYYFWVKATTTRHNRRALSLADVEQQLVSIPLPYMLFHGFTPPEERIIEGTEFSLPDRYTQSIVRGLRGIINSDDRYVLRFTRDFTLRDSLEHGNSSLDLKQLHAEWKLFRQEQQFVLDRYLWDKVTEAMAGYLLTNQTIRVPSLDRELYDTIYNSDTRFGLRANQAFVDGELAKASILAYLTDPDIDFSPTNITVFFDLHNFDTSENIISAMDAIYNTFSFEHTNRMFFSVLHDAFSNKIRYPDIFKTSMIALHGIRILEAQGAFDD